MKENNEQNKSKDTATKALKIGVGVVGIWILVVIARYILFQNYEKKSAMPTIFDNIF